MKAKLMPMHEILHEVGKGIIPDARSLLVKERDNRYKAIYALEGKRIAPAFTRKNIENLQRETDLLQKALDYIRDRHTDLMPCVNEIYEELQFT